MTDPMLRRKKSILEFLTRHPGHLIWILFAYLPFLGKYSVPLTGDQKLYMSQAIEMVEQGNWLQPFLYGGTSYFKPPIQYWGALLGWKIFGFNLFGTLIPSVIALLITAYFLGEIAYLLKERRWFVNAGLIFAATLGTATYGTVMQTEIYLGLFYALAWWAGLKFLADPDDDRKTFWLLIAFGSAGLLSLAKSPVYSAFWVLGYFFYLFAGGEWDLFRRKRLYLSLFWGILVGVSWFAVIMLIDRERFWAEYVVRETFEKKGGNQSSILGFWAGLLTFCFPFTLLIFPSLRAIRKGRHTGRMALFVFCWSALPFLFFSIFPYRVKPYLYIIVPALAVLIDWGFFRLGRSRAYRWVFWVSGLLVLLVSGFLAWILFRVELAPIWISLGFLGVGLLSIFSVKRDSLRGFAFCALAWVFFFRAAAVSLGEADIAGLREVAAENPRAPIGMLDESRNIWHERGMFQLALERPVKRMDRVEEAEEFLARGGVLVLSPEQAEEFWPKMQSDLAAHGVKFKEVAWSRWKTRTKFPFKQLLLHGRSGVEDFESVMKRKAKIVVGGQ